ncbi:MAG: hemerythrin cation binding domain protein [Paucimonas sp.]|nr:hemerythrin cation binding domain protein [Paucimonas sp.]
MTEQLMPAAPGFDQPVAVLKHCHDRIRKQLETLEGLQRHLQQQGTGVEAQQAASAVLRYFNQAAPQHHADEEVDLLPMLEQTATGDDAAMLASLKPQILDEHQQMEQCWQVLEAQLQAVAQGAGASLAAEDVERFSTLYASHMEKEEGTVAPMAKRLFSQQQMTRLGNAMRERRGIRPES